MNADDLIRTMDSFVGIAEDPPGSNNTPIGVEFGYNRVPWCAETVSVACERNGFPLHEAAVIQIVNRAKSGWLGMSWSTTPVRGSAVCFDWKGNNNPNDMHTGLVYEVLGDGQFRTIEGNYRDRCDRWLRDMRYVNGFACFPFDAPPPPIPPKPPEDEMQKVHLWSADVDSDDKRADGQPVIDHRTVFIIGENLEFIAQSPDEPWLAGAAHKLGPDRILPPEGDTRVVSGVTVEVVGVNFLRPIVLR